MTNQAAKPAEELSRSVSSPIFDSDAREVASQFYEKLQEAGLCGRDVLSISSQLIGIATDSIRKENDE